MPSINELQRDLKRAELGARAWEQQALAYVEKLAAQQQEIERLRGAIQKHADAKGHDRCWLNDRELYAAIGMEFDPQLPPKAEFLARCEQYHAGQSQAAQRKGERVVNVEALVNDLAVRAWKCDSQHLSGPELYATFFMPIVRRHLEPQGEPHERDEVPVRDSAVRVSGVSVEPGVSGASAATAPQRERVEVACGDGRSVESVQAVAAQAVAPASPVRDAGYSVCILESELAALRKQVEDGERDTKRLDWLQRKLSDGSDWSCVFGNGRPKVIRWHDGPDARQASGATLREAIDAATPEPKEPANG